MKNFFVVLILVSAAGKFASGATPQIIQSILTKTDDCFQCGMLEGFGYLDIKVYLAFRTNVKRLHPDQY